MTFAAAHQQATAEQRYLLDERAAILEYEADFPRAEAERRAVEELWPAEQPALFGVGS